MENLKKEIEDMTKEEVTELMSKTNEIIEENNKEIQKLIKRISNLKKDNKFQETSLIRGNSRLRILELEELVNSVTKTEY